MTEEHQEQADEKPVVKKTRRKRKTRRGIDPDHIGPIDPKLFATKARPNGPKSVTQTGPKSFIISW